jgi:hypothetical protein
MFKRLAKSLLTFTSWQFAEIYTDRIVIKFSTTEIILSSDGTWKLGE